MQKIYLFIDTCEFRRLIFFFGKFKLSKIVELAKSGKIQLLINDITEREIQKHLLEKVKQTDKAIREFLGRAYFLDAFAEFEEVRSKLEWLQDDLNRAALNKFDKFLEETKAKKVNFDEVNVAEIFTDYFSEKPPFGGKGKKHEFPDAFVLKSLARWAQEHNETVHLISNDSDFKSACKVHDCLKHFEDIPNFLEYYTEEEVKETIRNFAVNIYKINECDIEAQIKNSMYNKNAQSDLYFLYNDEVSDIEIDNLKVVKKALTGASEASAEFDLTVSAEITATHIMFNPNSQWGIFYTESVRFEYVHIEEFQVTVELSFNPNDSAEAPEIDVIILSEYLGLNIDDFDISEVTILDSWDNVNID